MILGQRFFVTPSDSLAIIAANATVSLLFYYFPMFSFCFFKRVCVLVCTRLCISRSVPVCVCVQFNHISWSLATREALGALPGLCRPVGRPTAWLKNLVRIGSFRRP